MPDHNPADTKKRRHLMFRVCFGLGTFVLLILLFDPKQIAETLAGANPLYTTLAFLMCMVVMLVRACRWQLILRDMNILTRFWRIAEIYLISNWFSTFLPGSVGGDIYKVYGLTRDGKQTLHSLATVFIERFTGLLALISVALVTVIFFSHMMPAPLWMMLALVSIIAGALFLLLFSTRFIQPVGLFLRNHAPLFRKWVSEEKIALTVTIFQDMLHQPRLFVRAYVLGIFMQFLVLASYYFVARALNQHIPFLFFLIFFPLIEIISLIPVSINGMGIRELLLVFFLRYAAVEPSFAISFSILLRLILVVYALFGGYLLIRNRSKPVTSIS
ncbi:MAG: YbhN family protein [Desulfatirhabdiaceae bacterium]